MHAPAQDVRMTATTPIPALLPTYAPYPFPLVKGEGDRVFDDAGGAWWDFYGGHCVCATGHSHPAVVKAVADQAASLLFYSAAAALPVRDVAAERITAFSGMDSVFFCNSGAEANENALKLASFHTGKARIIAFEKSFHGRTSAAVAVTDNPKIIAPLNDTVNRTFLPLNNIEALESALQVGDVAAVIVEGIQGIGGCRVPEPAFLDAASSLCKKYGVILILDEIQSGYARSGKFFAHQYANIQPDIISVAKGMGNGFPIGGILINPELKPWSGMLGTTFGGNYLACAAGIAVLDIMKEEKLVENALEVGNYLLSKVAEIPQIKEIRGKGLMIGLEFDFPIAPIRKQLLFEEKIFTGVTGTHTIRILPPLILNKEQIDHFIGALLRVLKKL